MQELELLQSIRPIWLNRTVQVLARGANLREDIRTQLEQFFHLLEEAIETGNPNWLDPILSVWVASLTQSDLESELGNVSRFIKVLMEQMSDVCRENLNDSAALRLMSALIPIFAYAFERTSQLETQAHIAYVSNQLAQVQQTLEKLDRSKSDFISVAAHELKTPLTLVEGYAAMLNEIVDSKNGSQSTQKLLLDGIHHGTRRLQDIINDMIDVSLIDNNLLALNLQPLWINRLLSALQSELSSTLAERHLDLQIKPFVGSNEMTYGDPERMMQVFRNVLTNAIKYTPDSGRITVDGRKLPGFIEVTITDTGIGIDLEDQSLIFEKFSRLGNTALHSSGKTKFKGGGPGLGLHIAKGIIETHGGAIWAESQGYNEACCPGSTFHVLLPMRTQPPNDHTAKLFAPLHSPPPD